MKKGPHIKKIKGTGEKSKSIVVLPNGYGPLQYIDELIQCLQSDFHDIYVPTLSGQLGVEGTLTKKTAITDLETLLKEAAIPFHKKNTALIHCSSLLYYKDISEELIQLFPQTIIYNLLTNIEELEGGFIEKAKTYNTHIATSKDIESILIPEDINHLPNITIIHPQTQRNNRRTKNLQAFQKSGDFTTITPESGYEISNQSQKELIKKIYNNHLKHILSQIEKE